MPTLCYDLNTTLVRRRVPAGSWHMPKNLSFNPKQQHILCQEKFCAQWWLLANVRNVCWPNVVSTLYIQHVLRWRNVAPKCWPYDGSTSKLTLGQRSLSTLGQRSGQPKYTVGPTLPCYLRDSICLNFVSNNN